MQEAIEKAESAYGDTVRRDLKKAIQHLSERKGRLDDCMSALKINETPKALLWSKIRMLGKKKNPGIEIFSEVVEVEIMYFYFPEKNGSEGRRSRRLS